MASDPLRLRSGHPDGCRQVLTSGGRNPAQERETRNTLRIGGSGDRTIRDREAASVDAHPDAAGVDALHFSAHGERKRDALHNPQVSMGGCAGVPRSFVTDRRGDCPADLAELGDRRFVAADATTFVQRGGWI